MAKKMKVSLSLKLTLIVMSISAIIIFTITFVNLQSQTNYFVKDYVEKTRILVKSFDASIDVHGDFSHNQTLQWYIENVSKNNNEILQLSISIPHSGKFIVLASNNRSLIGTPSSSYSSLAYEQHVLIYNPVDIGSSHLLDVTAPMNVTGHTVGTYEIQYSMDRTYATFDAQMRTLITVSVACLIVLILWSTYLLRRTIVNPIRKFRNVAQLVGEGKLDEKIQINSRDELGDLAATFNQMTTDLKTSRQKIMKYSETLEGLLKQKDEFITQLGHDLKNPLMPIVGLSPLILAKVQDPELQKHLTIIIRNARYMRDLILKTLELASLRSQTVEFTLESFHLFDMVKQILENQDHLFAENHVVVQQHIPKDLLLHADKLRFEELMNNLLTNAVKYTPGSGGVITIGATQDERFITVSVQDTGIGMTRDQIDQVFDEFYKVARTKQEFDSSGLGLSICRRIVERHGGTIWAESKGPGKGSTFFFTIPL